jgi:hypothetical protein
VHFVFGHFKGDEVTIDGVHDACICAIPRVLNHFHDNQHALLECAGHVARRTERGGRVAGCADDDDWVGPLSGDRDARDRIHRPQYARVSVGEVGAEPRSNRREFIDVVLDYVDRCDIAVVETRDGEECLEFVAVGAVILALVVLVVEVEQTLAVVLLGIGNARSRSRQW